MERLENTGRARLVAVDLLRGLVMVLMALDHARDYFGDFSRNPADLATTTPALFYTRWVTHFCAPVFVALAGTGAWLYGHGGGARGRTRGQLARFLLTRGAWLVVLEFTLVQSAWMFSLSSGFWFQQVIAAIGAAMIALAGLVFLPTPAVAAIGFAIVAGHNLLDGIEPEHFGPAGSWAWLVLHEGGPRWLPNGDVYLAIYPLLPWIGVMALGYALGPWTRLVGAPRVRRLVGTGLAACAAFVALRWLGVYGDPTPWEPQPSTAMTLVAFLNCQKYPPSLLYLLMTLGPALVLLGLTERAPGRLGRALVTFGRVPLFYYVAHMALIHAAALAFYRVTHGQAFSGLADGLPRLFRGEPLPEWYGYPLWVVYAAWLAVVVALYPACAWYARVKRRGRSPLWSYL